MKTTSFSFWRGSLFCAIVIILFYVKVDQVYLTVKKIFSDDSSEIPMKPPVIMAWNEFFDANLSAFLLDQTAGCQYYCEIVPKNENISHLADAIIFHGRNEFKPPTERLKHQMYVLFLQEAPPHVGHIIKKFPPDFYNLSLTYRKANDFNYEASYGHLERITGTPSNWTDAALNDIISKKKYGALTFVSNCNTISKRERYIAELSKYFNVTNIGKCGGKKGPKCARFDTKCENQLYATHRFYLAFENSACTDYITEKFFKAKYMIVPIVLKRSVLKNFIPDHMFIAADDYSSPKELASYLTYLSKNETAYKSYFAWSKEYRIVENFPGICKLCEDLHTKKNRKIVIKNIVKYVTEDQCENDFALKLLSTKS